MVKERQNKFQSFYFYEVLENPGIIPINSLVCEKDLRFWELTQLKNANFKISDFPDNKMKGFLSSKDINHDFFQEL